MTIIERARRAAIRVAAAPLVALDGEPLLIAHVATLFLFTFSFDFEAAYPATLSAIEVMLGPRPLLKYRRDP